MGWILVVIIPCVMLISYLTTDLCSYLVVFLYNVMGPLHVCTTQYWKVPQDPCYTILYPGRSKSAGSQNDILRMRS